MSLDEKADEGSGIRTVLLAPSGIRAHPVSIQDNDRAQPGNDGGRPL